MHKVSKYLLFSILALSLFSSCRKDQFNIKSDAQLILRADTLWFDTVFTRFYSTRPKSVNKQIVIVNPYKDKLKTNIELAGGPTSHFRINVDGVPGYSFSNLEIYPNDSLFIFVEVHPDKNNNNPDFNPLIIRDSILFNTNGNEQKVNLIGWGQDAHYFFRDSITSDTTWSNSALPIVVYGYVYVKPGVKLTIEEGMNIHFAPYSWLFVEGEVDIIGSVQNPIIMQGDRLEPDWEETPGQWGGIWINYPSLNNNIEYAIIKNGTVGVYCDTISGDDNISPNVVISKCFIRNMLYDGIAAKGSNVMVRNTVSSNCGRFTFLASEGGIYDLRHCTFFTNGMTFSRQSASVGILNRDRDEFNNITATYDIECKMYNCIIDGNRPDFELGFDIETDRAQLSFINNIVKTPQQPNGSLGSGNFYEDPLFVDPFKYNYQLDSLSPAKDKGVGGLGITDDIEDFGRDVIPDIGAYESRF